MTVDLELADYLLIAEAVLGVPAELIADFNRTGLADSALAAPRAGFGGVEAYPDFATKAAVLCWHLVKNHPLPDGNKRAAWVTLRLFVEMNGWIWRTYPGVDEAERAVLAVSSSEWDEEQTAAWLRPLLGGPPNTADK